MKDQLLAYAAKRGITSCGALLDDIAKPGLAASVHTVKVEKPAGQLALEAKAVAAILALAQAVRPGMTLAQVQALPTVALIEAIKDVAGKATQAVRVNLLMTAAELQTIYAALSAADIDWRSPDFGQPDIPVLQSSSKETPSWWQANFPDQPLPSKNQIRKALQS